MLPDYMILVIALRALSIYIFFYNRAAVAQFILYKKTETEKFSSLCFLMFANYAILILNFACSFFF